MNVEVNLLSVLLAAFSTMVVGSIWYTPKVFGDSWMKLAKLDRKELDKNGVWPIVITAVVSLISAYVLAYMAYVSNQFLENSFFQDSLTTAFLLWLGFTAARMITHDAFEGRRKNLTLLNISHEFVTIMIMGTIIGLIN